MLLLASAVSAAGHCGLLAEVLDNELRSTGLRLAPKSDALEDMFVNPDVTDLRVLPLVFPSIAFDS